VHAQHPVPQTDHTPSDVDVSWRLDDGTTRCLPWRAIGGIDKLAAAAPWPTFRWHKGQKHYSGTYWSATMRAHVRRRIKAKF
jgi:hypothetical protein